jgi:hypothetical protein
VNQATRIAIIGFGLLSSAAAALAADDPNVLTQDSLWRTSITWRHNAIGTARDANDPGSLAREASEWGRWIRVDFTEPTPLPAEGWQAAEFDDASWPRRRADLQGRFGYEAGGCAALVALRARFAVADPAKAAGLALRLGYLGGAVVHVNGAEVARKHLPPGAITPLTLAEDYPAEVFFTPGTTDAPLRKVEGRNFRATGELAERYEQRIRKAVIDIPASALRKGTNVLAIEVHRTAIPAAVEALKGGIWSTAGVSELKLTAPASAGVRGPTCDPNAPAWVWTADPLTLVGVETHYGDDLEPPRPIRLVAPVNGVASGQAVVASQAGIENLSATIGDLSAGGSTIPAKAARIRYGVTGDAYMALLDKPKVPPEAQPPPFDPRRAKPGTLPPPAPKLPRLQPVWVTVKVPAGTAAGTYRGTLTIAGLDKPVAVPVELRVAGWKVGEPPDWQTWVNLMQSPESVAGVYDVPIWSDKHFDLMAGSLAAMGYLGNDVLSVNAVAKTVFGNDPLLVWKRDASAPAGWKPELKYLRRYLTLYDKQAGAPRLLSVQVWHYGMYYSAKTRDGSISPAQEKVIEERERRERGDKDWKFSYPYRARTVPIWELAGDKFVDANMPIYGEKGTEELWTETLAGIRQIFKDLQWDRTQLLLGTSGDAPPAPQDTAFFKKVAPGVRWRAATHGGAVARWGLTDAERTQGNGMVVGFANLVRRNEWRRVEVPEAPSCVIARDGIGTSPFEHLTIAPLAVAAADYDGFCWFGVDYWPFSTGEKRQGVLAKYVGFGNIIPHRTMTLVVPGPSGALTTVQVEMLREGIQLNEAAIFLKRVLADKDKAARLGAPLAKQCRDAVQELVDVMESGRRLHPQGNADVQRLVARVYQKAEEVAKIIGS